MARIGELTGPNGEVMHPKTSAEVVCLEDGRTVEQVLSDDVDYGNVVFQDNSYKFDSDVEDDFAKTVIIKGQTYQNILPEPSTHVLTNNKEMFKVNEGLDPNVEIVDAVSKSAILSGQTLVNLFGFKEPITVMTDRVRLFSSDNFKNNLLNDTYTIINTSNKKIALDINNKSTDVWEKTVTLLGGQKTSVVFNNTYIRMASFSFSEGWSNDNLEEIKCSLVVLNGEHTNIDIPYFEGMQSVRMPVLTTSDTAFIDNKVALKIDATSNPPGQIAFNTVNGDEIQLNNPSSVENVGFNGDYLITGKDTYFSCDYNDKIYACEVTYEQHKVTNNAWGDFVSEGNFKVHQAVRSLASTTGNWLETNYPIFEYNQKMHVLFVNDFEKKTKSIFLNGVKVAHKSGVPFTEQDFDVQIATLLKNVQGKIYSFRLYNQPLTDEEIIAIFKREEKNYKTNILTTPEEVVLRSLPNGVYDTLNLNTGEYVQRIGEMKITDEMIDKFTIYGNFINNFDSIFNGLPERNTGTFGAPSTISMVSDKMMTIGWNSKNMAENVVYFSQYSGTVRAYHSPDWTLDEFKEWFRENKPTIQYELATPVIKTVDLLSSGNWEKVVLDGSEDGWFLTSNASQTTVRFRMNLNPQSYGVETGFCDRFAVAGNTSSNMETESIMLGDAITIRIKKDKAETLNEFKQWLSQNPVTVWYQTATHLDSTQVKQPIFFKDGHIQLSSGADNSLIPTLDYQAKTSNSYVMDLMKPNTKYTMKAKSASGTFTIDGTSYGAGTSGTFTTPSSMTNKLLVMSNKTNEEIMILEGDVTSKTIPYFKGIKSAFEGEDKIEVLSTDSNLLINNQRLQEEGVLYLTKGWSAVRLTTKAKKVKIVVKNKTGITGTKFNVKDDIENESNFMQLFAINEVFTTIEREYSLKNSNVISFCSYGSSTFSNGTFFDNYDIEVYTLDNMDETLVVEKSNSTKIPLLSPLRSLPNGVCDELIVDRIKKKATLIQRVGVDIYNGSEWWACYNESSSKTVEGYCHTVQNLGGGGNNTNLLSNSFRANYRSIHNRDEEGVGSQQDATYSDVRICISRTKLFPLGYTVGQNNRVAFFQKWLQSNPVTVLYPLLTPVVTEIDLEGFPYIYKEGHIFLNSEIAPTVGVEYSINQGHRISSQVETLQRHEQQFTKLERYFADLVHSDYNFALLRFSEKLHQQEGDV